MERFVSPRIQWGVAGLTLSLSAKAGDSQALHQGLLVPVKQWLCDWCGVNAKMFESGSQQACLVSF